MFKTNIFGKEMSTLFEYQEIQLCNLRKYSCICNNIEEFRFEIEWSGDAIIVEFKGIPDLELYNTTSLCIGDISEIEPLILAVEKIVISILTVRKFFAIEQQKKELDNG